MSTPIEKALLDVRKAYRLLADYQQRILELLGFIRGELGAVYYYQHFRNKVPSGLQQLELKEDGGERLLPFNDMSMFWIKNGGQGDYVHMHQKGDLLIDVFVRSDTGNGEEEEEILSPEESRSELRIYFFLCVEPKEESHNWYHKVWTQTDYPALGKVGECDGNPGYLMYGESLNLAELVDEGSTRKAIKDLRQRASVGMKHEI